MAGIHLHPHDILDEGSEAILKRIDKMRHVDHLFVEINTIFERNPYPIGILPHNPRHEVVQGTGTLHIQLDKQNTPLSQRVDPTIIAGADPLFMIKQATDNSRFKVIPWANILNGDFTGSVVENQVIDFRGNPVEYWLCPNGPDVITFWTTLFSQMKARYGYSTFLIDRIRYPDWAGKSVSPRGLLTCFCSHCQQKMQQQGMDILAIKQRLEQVTLHITDRQYEQAIELLLHDPLIQAWQHFRQRSVSLFVKQLLSAVSQQSEGNIELWLDLWPPAYAWILGQNYTELTEASSALKHFPYHKLGGGADVQGLIEFVADNDSDRERAFTAFKRLFSLPYTLSYQQFKLHGFPIEFVKQQNDKVRQLSQPGTFIYSGIQMWNLPANELIQAIQAAEQSDCNDLLYYCYGWADQPLFDAVSTHYQQQQA